MGIIVAAFTLVGFVALFLLNEFLYEATEDSTEQHAAEPYSHKEAA